MSLCREKKVMDWTSVCSVSTNIIIIVTSEVPLCFDFSCNGCICDVREYMCVCMGVCLCVYAVIYI